MKNAFDADLDQKELDTLLLLSNTLRPFTFPGTVTEAYARIPFIVLANCILKTAGYPEFMREICPYIQPHGMHAVDLDAGLLYEIFCRREGGSFNVKKGNGYTTSYTEACDSNIIIWHAFFDMDHVRNICFAHGLRFADRITVKRDSAIMTGTVMSIKLPEAKPFPESLKAQNVLKRFPVQSAHENALKKRGGRRDPDHTWLPPQHLDLETIKKSIDNNKEELNKHEAELKKISEELADITRD